MKTKHFLYAVNIILTIADMISDIILAVDYCVTDNHYWCGLTWAFIAGPIFSFFFIFTVYRSDDTSTKLIFWTCTENCFESGPELILQLYILTLLDQDPTYTGGSTFTTILQVIAIVTSFLSLSVGFVRYRNDAEKENENKWTWVDIIVDMVWTTLSISPRVIGLVLFASCQLYWFWGLIISQVVVITVFCFVVARMRLSKLQNLFESVFFSILTGVGSTFTMFVALYFDVYFYYYLLYWFMMFTENMVMISLWYQWSSNFEFWYHGWAICYINSGYVLSLIIKLVHTYIYNERQTNVLTWSFSKCIMLTKKAERKAEAKADAENVQQAVEASDDLDPRRKSIF